MTTPILLCSDLDRTLLPNGRSPESPEARPLLRQLAAHPEVTLAYVSGRHQALLQEAIESYQLPEPDFAIGDVGTTIYEIRDGSWDAWQAWSGEIAPDWRGMSREDIADLLQDVDNLTLQEAEKQNTFKLSYYAPSATDREALVAAIDQRLDAQGVRASIIWSIDEVVDRGLLDILPASANKLHAIRFLMNHKGFLQDRTVFAGDSGNDLPVLTSGLQSILVANAHPDVQIEALEELAEAEQLDKLYIAKGGFMQMNGNYAAGVLEGLVHFLPETRAWLKPH